MKVSELIKGLVKRKIRPPAIWSLLDDYADRIVKLEDDNERLKREREQWDNWAEEHGSVRP